MKRRAFVSLCLMTGWLHASGERERQLERDLITVVEAGDCKRARKLLSRGALLEATNWQRRTPFLAAAASGNPRMLTLLRDAGADTQEVDHLGRAAVHLAARAGSTATIRELFRCDMVRDVDVCDLCAWTALHHAVECAHEDTVRELIACHATIDASSAVGRNPLHLAVRAGRYMIMGQLLCRGATVDCIDTDLQTPLHYAAERGDFAAIRLLLAYGARSDLPDKFSRTARDIWSCKMADARA